MPANILVTLGQPVSARGNLSIIELTLSASPAVQLVLLLLIGMSVATWGIIFLKSQSFRRAALESQDIRHEMSQEGSSLADLRDMVDDFRDAPEAELIRDGFDLWTRSRTSSTADRVRWVGSAIERATRQEVLRMERHLTLLATTGSAAPFIGLFGTVYGIMNTFAALGKSGSTALSVVAPGIAEALRDSGGRAPRLHGLDRQRRCGRLEADHRADSDLPGPPAGAAQRDDPVPGHRLLLPRTPGPGRRV